MAELQVDDVVSPDESKSSGTGGQVRKWTGRVASIGVHFLTVASITVLGGVAGLICGSWVASSRVESVSRAVQAARAGRAVDFAPDFEPELSIAATWIVSLAGCGLVGLIVGLVAGILVVRAFAASSARKQGSSGLS